MKRPCWRRFINLEAALLFIEQQAQRQHKDLQEMSLAEMDELWEQAKRQLKPEEKPMTLPHPCSKYNAVLLFLLCLGAFSHLHCTV